MASGTVNAQILRLAVPAFLALVSEPLFLLADSAIVGHLGTTPLAGLGIAGTVMSTVVSLCIFLAYGTTASVARRIGAGDTRGALAQGIDGIWLAVLIGAVVTTAGQPLLHTIVGWFGPTDEVGLAAAAYLRIALLGTVPMLVMLAATGVLRGMQDTRTPLVVAIAANGANVALNLTFVYGLDLGIAGSAWGTVLAQFGAAAALTAVVIRGATRVDAKLTPDRSGITAAARAGIALIVRTLTLRAVLVLMTLGATRLGSDDLAAMQLAMTFWVFFSFVLDAIAIAAQAMTGQQLGAGDLTGTRTMTTIMIRWGLWSGLVTGVLLAGLAFVVGPLFTPDPAVQELLVPALLVAALSQPLCGIVFVLDGVLIGAGDGRYLAWAGVIVLAGFVPAWALALGTVGNLAGLWFAFATVFIGGRTVLLMARARSNTWMRVGAG